MRNFLKTAVFTLVIAYQANAQAVGAYVGSNTNNVRISGVSNSINPNTSFITGLNAGLTYELGLGSGVSFGTGISYMEKGFSGAFNQSVKLGNVSIPLSAGVKTDVKYVEVPLNFIYTTGGEKLKYYVSAGPSIGHALKGTATVTANMLVDLNLYSADIDLNNENANRWDIAGNVGGGLKYKVGGGHIVAGVGYQHSFSSGVSNSILNIKMKNSGINSRIGFALDL